MSIHLRNEIITNKIFVRTGISFTPLSSNAIFFKYIFKNGGVLSTLYLGIAVIRVILKTPVLSTLYLGIAVIRVILKTPVLSTLYLGIAVIRVILKTPVLSTLYLGIAVIRVILKTPVLSTLYLGNIGYRGQVFLI
jgi:hypothetical protein